MWCDQKSLLCLATLVQNDVAPRGGTADAAYAFANTRHVEQNILDGMGDLYAQGRSSRVILQDLAVGYPYYEKNPIDRYSGFEAWRDYLAVLRHIDPAVIQPLSSPSPKPGEMFPRAHTGSEAEGIVLLARERGWRSIYVVSHPIHQLRCFALAVTMAESLYPDLKIYSWPGRQIKRWNEKAPRGQDVAADDSQFDFLGGELERLNKSYGNHWDPLPAQDIIEYVRRRDS
jgi:hypothetical protein